MAMHVLPLVVVSGMIAVVQPSCREGEARDVKAVVVCRDAAAYELVGADHCAGAGIELLDLFKQSDDQLREIVSSELVDDLRSSEEGVEVLFVETQHANTTIRGVRRTHELDRIFIPLTGKYAGFGAAMFFGDGEYEAEVFVNLKGTAAVRAVYDRLVASEEFARVRARVEESNVPTGRVVSARSSTTLASDDAQTVVDAFRHGITIREVAEIDVTPGLLTQLSQTDRVFVELVYTAPMELALATTWGHIEFKRFKKVFIEVPERSLDSIVFVGDPSYRGRSLHEITMRRELRDVLQATCASVNP